MSYAYYLNNLCFAYAEKTVLSLSALSIPAGKITVIIGPNGCGKSTLLNLLAFMETPGAGEMCFFGVKVTPEHQFSYRKNIGFLPQKPFLLRGTVEENLKLALKLRGTPKIMWPKKISAVLERLNIKHLLDRQSTSLSGGEVQKTALARALVTDPEIVLLDEPFSFLDQSGSQFLEQFVVNYLKETQGTLIFSTHDRLHGLALADEVISLVNGELINSPLINLYHGCCNNHAFNTGKITIILTRDMISCQHVSIDPHEIVLSRQPLISSMRNQFLGRIMTISEEMGKVRITVAAGEIFQVLITYESLQDLSLNLGDAVWVNFKSNSVTAF